MNAQDTTIALGGRWTGREGRALCPVCGGSKDNPPLSIQDGLKGLLIYCHKSECSFKAIADELRLRGLDGALREQDTGQNLIELREAARDDIKKKADQAQRCWAETEDLSGAMLAYLEHRQISFRPATLRAHPACWHGPTADRYPAMIARVDGADSFAVHRTYLTSYGRKAEIAPNKMTLGRVWGGAVRLATEDTPLLIVGEGIESTLSFAQIEGRLANVWAALSTSGLKNLRLPREPGILIIAQDGDTPGREAAQALAARAYVMGWNVKLADPGDGKDFNDLLQAEAVAW